MKRRVGTLQFVVAGTGHRSPPQVVGAGMNQAEGFLGVQKRKSFQPSQAFWTDAGERRRNQLFEYGEKGGQLRRGGCKSSKTFRGPKHLVCIPADTGPPEGAELIDNLCPMRSTIGQITAMNHDVRRDLSQVRENCFEGAEVPMNIRYDRASHFVRRRCDSGLDAARCDIRQAIFCLGLP